MNIHIDGPDLIAKPEGEAGEAGTVLTHLDTQTVVVKAPALRRLLARIESLTTRRGS